MTILQKNLNKNLQTLYFYLIETLLEVRLHLVYLILQVLYLLFKLVNDILAHWPRFASIIDTPAILSAFTSVLAFASSAGTGGVLNVEEILVNVIVHKFFLLGFSYLADVPVEVALIEHLIILENSQILQILFNK